MISTKLTKSKLVKGFMLVGLSLGLMGNDSCSKTQKPAEGRMLRRRVQLDRVNAPQIELPPSYGSRKFDFAYVANIQMYDILRRTQSFSTANVDSGQSWDPSDLTDEAKDEFNQCEDTEEVQSFDARTGQKIYSTMSKSSTSSSAACLIDMPQAVIEGDIFNFELISGGGISVGLGSIKFLKDLNFSFEKYQLDVTLRAKAPMEISKNHYFSTTLKQSYGKKMSVGATVDFGSISLSPKYYFQSPLSKVVDDGLTQAVTELRDNWTKDDPWYATVMKSCDKFLYINGGYGNDAGLKVGDILQVKNVKYFWEGQSCHSRLKGELPMQTVAYVRIVTVGRNIAAAEIIERDPNYPHLPDRIYPGARVYLHKMIEQIQAEQNPKQNKKR